MSDSTRLPSRPSLHQLHKQAKDLLKQYRSGDTAAAERLKAHDRSPIDVRGASHPITLADAQFTLAREYGFATWAALKQHVESLKPSALDQFERVAQDLAAAYISGDDRAIQEINWSLGTSFLRDRNPDQMRRQLGTWFNSESRTQELAIKDARRMVAHAYGFDSWEKFAASFNRPPRRTRSSLNTSQSPPFYTIDWDRRSMSVRGPQIDGDWETLRQIADEHQVIRLEAGGMTEFGMDQISRVSSITQLCVESNQLTDAAVLRLAGMPWLEELDISGVNGLITDNGLGVLSSLPNLRTFKMCWQPRVSDAGIARLGSCDLLEDVNLMGTATGDGAIRALAGKQRLRKFKTGRGVTDAGLLLLHELPVFKEWRGGKIDYGLMRFDCDPNHLMIDGPFTDAGIANLVGLDGLFGLGFFWHCPAFTGAGLAPLKALPNLGMLGCGDDRCDDDAMAQIGEMPGLRMLMAQGTVATDKGFAALSRSKTIEHIWGRECPNLTGSGFAALAAMPSLKGLAVSCKNVDDKALSTLPAFPALRALMPMDVPDEGFRHVGRCAHLEDLWCMYCRETGDAATEHISGLSLKTYYAGQTQITDKSLEILGRMTSLEDIRLWACRGVTDSGIAALAELPRLREVTLDNMPNATRDAVDLFAPGVKVSYTG